MAKIGYMRVSKNDQNTDLQQKSLICANCDQIFEDKISGKTDQRPGLKRALNCLKTGDTLVVWKLDRLGRSIKHLIALISELEDKGIHFHSLTDAIDTSTSAGRFFFHVMSALAQMERELIVERTLAGLAVARSQGRIGGRRSVFSKADQAQAARLLAKGHSRKEVAMLFNISLASVYKYLPLK
ncbi:recombinase family protein [Candidatus Hamiltonella defensa]|uniref:recombinase family protein n=1 Tax=Candidatus Williamhamiltonella defendens TaxID=138072 RepID=UPI001583A01A|nr:recombinase family protein [Candidatus Hamiltonella defensa]